MKKRVLSACLAVILALSLLCVNIQAAGADLKLETLQALGIIVGDGSGNAALDSLSTRAQFTKMLVAASAYKDSVGGGASLFKDLDRAHWANGYVRVAVEQGWMSGYADGTFRPDRPVTLEEGCSALLKLLGYDASALKGTYPTAQLSKAGSIGLLDGISAGQGTRLTRRDCVELFYNLLTVTASSGTAYGATLGCTITDGQVDYSALVVDGLKGPYTAGADGVLELPFALEAGASISYDGAPAAVSAVKQYDIYYYNENTHTVWVYNDRIIGALSEVSPNRISPEAVTVAGQSYRLENSAVSQKLSGFKDDEPVTLLLGKDGQVADILQGVHGELDQDAYLAVVDSDTKGPYIAVSGVLDLPFDGGEANIYRNGSPAQLSSARNDDVYYYNSTLQTVWIYSSRVTGTLTDISPNTEAPASVTVAGVSYNVGTSEAVYQLSNRGTYHEGDTVTLLLGMNGEVVRVIDAQQNEVIYYGLVISSTKEASSTATTSSSTASVQTATQVACTDGVVRTFYHSGSTLSTGRLAAVSTTQSGTSVKSLSAKKLEGTVSGDGATFAGHSFADGVQILDTDSNGGYVRIYPSRLANAKLSGNDVCYYTLDANGDIDRMILQNVTGDTQTYVYVSGIEDNSREMNISVNYTYISEGQFQSLNSSAKYAIKVGGAVMIYEKGGLKSIRQLASVNLDSLSSLSAMGGDKEYKLAEHVQVLLRDGTGGQGYYLTALSQINGEDYKLTGWYDTQGYSAGGRVRIIVAVPK